MAASARVRVKALLDAGVEDEGGDDALFHHAALHAVHLDGIKVDGDGVEDVFRERVPAAVLVLAGVRAVHVWLKPARLGADDAETSPEGGRAGPRGAAGGGGRLG